eukprot:2998935-Prymnesium_polylepis.1
MPRRQRGRQAVSRKQAASKTTRKEGHQRCRRGPTCRPEHSLRLVRRELAPCSGLVCAARARGLQTGARLSRRCQNSDVPNGCDS